MTNAPDFLLESSLIKTGALNVVGVDEAGRGPLAGPVTAAAVRLDPAAIPDGLNDSKLLGPLQRVALFKVVMATADVSVAHASVEEIEELNILRAAHLAMIRAIDGLTCCADHALVDGNLVPRDLGIACTPVIKGDGRCLSIAAASIIAKVARDRIMVDLAQQYPGYGWETNMGYPSPAHVAALQSLGVTPHHRRTFKPVHNILYQDKTVSA